MWRWLLMSSGLTLLGACVLFPGVTCIECYPELRSFAEFLYQCDTPVFLELQMILGASSDDVLMSGLCWDSQQDFPRLDGVEKRIFSVLRRLKARSIAFPCFWISVV